MSGNIQINYDIIFPNGSKLPKPGSDRIKVTISEGTFSVDANFDLDTNLMETDVACISCGQSNTDPEDNDLCLKMTLENIEEIVNEETNESIKIDSVIWAKITKIILDYLENAECHCCGYFGPVSSFIQD